MYNLNDSLRKRKREGDRDREVWPERERKLSDKLANYDNFLNCAG